MNDKITIIVRRLNYVVKLPSMQYKYLIETMLVRLSTYSFKWDYKKKRNVRLRDKIFATEDNMRMEYRFNINTLKNFMLLLGNNYIGKDKLNIVFEKECYPAKLNCDLAEHITTRDYQNDYIDLLLKGKDTKPYMLVDLFTGYGKMLPVHTPIRVKNGWVKIGDLSVGDKVIGRDGLETTVIGVYPQGMKMTYRMIFQDGRYVDSGAEHLWTVYDEKYNESVLNTITLLERINNGEKYYIDLVIPQQEDEYGTISERIEKLKEIAETDIDISVGTWNIVLDNSDDVLLFTRIIQSLGGIAKVYDYSITVTFNERKLLEIDAIYKHIEQNSVCIRVDNKDQLYVIKDYIVTHNTTLSMAAITTIKQRTMILVLPKYIDKWISDVKANTTVKDEDIYVVKGGDSLNKLILAIEQGATYDFIIVGIRTIYNYIKSYETRLYDSEFSYERTPDELMEALGVGVILNDETHQEFHAVYKCGLYFNPCRFIGLSATLDNNDKNLVRMYDTMFPNDCRISGLVEYKHYIESYNIAYRIRNTKRIQYQRQQGYNHTLLEASIMRNSVLLKDYVNMITYYVKEGYYKRREEGDKALIFVASVKFATLLKQHMEVIFEDIDVRRYVEDDPYENLMDGDLIISTPNSAGVAVDIPGLISVYQTVAIKSLQMNKQTFGRLRNLKGKEMRYYSFYCKDIPKHKDMIRVRKEILLPFSKHWYEDEYNKTLEVV